MEIEHYKTHCVYPQHVGKIFNFRISIEFFNHEVQKTLKL